MLHREQEEEKNEKSEILKGKVKSYEPILYFKRQRVLPTEDAGFFALDITREQLIERFLSLSDNESSRYTLAEEIRSALIEGKIQDEEWQALYNEHAVLQTQIETAVHQINARLSKWITVPLGMDHLISYLKNLNLKEPIAADLNELRLQLRNSEKALVDFYEQESTFIRYVSHYYEGLPLGYRSALLFLKQLDGELAIDLFIWQQNEKDHTLSLVASEASFHNNEEHKRSIHLLYDATLTHFDLLIEKSEWKKRRHAFSDQPIEGREAFSQLLTPKPKSFHQLPRQLIAAQVVPYLTLPDLFQLANVSRLTHNEYKNYYLNHFLILGSHDTREKQLRLVCMTGNVIIARQMKLTAEELHASFLGDSKSKKGLQINNRSFNSFSKTKNLTMSAELNRYSRRPIEIAFHYEHQPLLDYFYETCFKPYYTNEQGMIDYHKKNDENCLLLHWAIICRQSLEDIETIAQASPFPLLSRPSHREYDEEDKSYSDDIYNQDVLFCAVMSQRIPVLRALLSRMPREVLSKSHRPLLKCAIKFNLPDMVSLLLEYGAQVKQEEFAKSNDHTYLWYAARAGHVPIIELLLRAGASASEVEKSDYSHSSGFSDFLYSSEPSDTALLAAVDSGSIEAVRLLLTAGADVVVNRPYALYGNRSNKTPLKTALSANHFEMVKLLTQYGADPFQIEDDREYSIPFLASLHIKDDRILRFFLENSSPENISKIDKRCLLFNQRNINSWNEKELSISLLLLQKGANVNQVYHFRTPLMTAIDRGNPVKYIEFLLSHGADVNQLDEKKETPLFHLMKSFLKLKYQRYQQKELIHLLLRYGAGKTLNQQNVDGETVLYMAYTAELFNFLLQKGVDPRISTEAGETLLHYHAQSSDGSDILRSLIKHFTLEDLNQQNKDGKTAIAFALPFITVETLQLLIESGADVNQADHQGQTPLTLTVKDYDKTFNQYRESSGESEKYRQSFIEYMKKIHEIIVILLNAGAHYTIVDAESCCAPEIKTLLKVYLDKRAELAATADHYPQIHLCLAEYTLPERPLTEGTDAAIARLLQMEEWLGDAKQPALLSHPKVSSKSSLQRPQAYYFIPERGETKHAQLRGTTPNGDCFFEAVGCAALTRDNLVEALLENANQEFVREGFALELSQFLALGYSGIVSPNSAENAACEKLLDPYVRALFSELDEAKEVLREQIVKIRSILGEENTHGKLPTELSQLLKALDQPELLAEFNQAQRALLAKEKTIRHYCCQEAVFTNYVKYYLRDARGYIPFSRTLQHERYQKTPMDVINRLFDLDIQVYLPSSHSSKKLTRLNRDHHNAQKTITVFHDGYNHFQGMLFNNLDEEKSHAIPSRRNSLNSFFSSRKEKTLAQGETLKRRCSM